MTSHAGTAQPRTPTRTGADEAGRRAVTIILARAGSRGVPGKNTADVAGRPCIAWTIDAAMRAQTVGRVIVTTDDATAARIALDLGAAVVERPADLAHDTARVDDAARHALDAAGRGDLRDANGPGEPVSIDDTTPVVVLYANVPVRPPDLIDRAVTMLVRTGCDSVQSYARVGKHHPWWTARLDETGQVLPWEGDVLNHGVFRRQDLPRAFVPDGGVIAVTARALRCGVSGVPDGPHAFFGLDRRGVETREGEVIDIDSPIDLRVADAVLRERLGGRGEVVHAHR